LRRKKVNSYWDFVEKYSALMREGKNIQLSRSTPSFRATNGGGVPKVLLLSPHPDDECIIGALPLRLQREMKMKV
jgi:hypothetical protein